MKGVIFDMQDSYRGKCVHSGIWEDCIMAHRNATREPIVALIIDLLPYESPIYLSQPFAALGL